LLGFNGLRFPPACHDFQYNDPPPLRCALRRASRLRAARLGRASRLALTVPAGERHFGKSGCVYD